MTTREKGCTSRLNGLKAVAQRGEMKNLAMDFEHHNLAVRDIHGPTDGRWKHQAPALSNPC